MGISPEKLKKARDTMYINSDDPADSVYVKGHDFSKPFDINEFVKSSGTTGFQATNLAKAVDIIKKMRAEQGCKIFFGYTSNMISSGVREAILHLVKNKMVDVLVTTAGGIEEDIIKCLGPFIMGDFKAKGAPLRKAGVNRIGNIFVPDKRYCDFEDFIKPIFVELTQKQKDTGHIITPSELIKILGERINNEESVYYWAAKNNIPVYCPAITDGSLGDILFFFKFNQPELKIDIAEDSFRLNYSALEPESTGIIVLGAGLVKHHINNANMFRDGAKYAVYINTAMEYDGSDAGAEPEEAISWGKIHPEAQHVKVVGDATILFPLITAAAFQK